MNHRGNMRAAGVMVAAVLVASLAGIASAQHFSEWGSPMNAEAVTGARAEVNTSLNDGCPIESPDGRSLYIASNRAGGLGGQDIWVAERATKNDPWGTPHNLGEPVNSPANDFCPTPLHGKRLLFVSERGGAGSCGGADIYITRLEGDDWADPENLGCDVNSAAGEAGPSLVQIGGQTLLFFSSTRPGGVTAEVPAAVAGDSDIYVSEEQHHGGFGAATPVDGLNTASDDFRPSVRKDGLEVVFDSNRVGTLGGQDIWSSSRERTAVLRSEQKHVGPAVSVDRRLLAPKALHSRCSRCGRDPGFTGASEEEERRAPHCGGMPSGLSSPRLRVRGVQLEFGEGTLGASLEPAADTAQTRLFCNRREGGQA